MTTRVLVVNLEGNQPVKVTTLDGDKVIAEKILPIGGSGWSDYIYDNRRVVIKEEKG